MHADPERQRLGEVVLFLVKGRKLPQNILCEPRRIIRTLEPAHNAIAGDRGDLAMVRVGEIDDQFVIR